MIKYLQGKRQGRAKKLADRKMGMYKFPSKQISVTDLEMPCGMKLDPDNRWVKKAQTIPWEEIEQRYAALYKNRKGNVAKPLQLALGALIIQTERTISDTEVPLQIQEAPCLQYFCGMPGCEDKLPFDSSLMAYFRKRLTPENLGDMIDELHNPKEGVKPRTYRKKARKNYLKTAKKRHKTAKEIRNSVKQQLQYVRRDLDIVDRLLESGKELSDWHRQRLLTIKTLYEQQLLMFIAHTHKVEH